MLTHITKKNSFLFLTIFSLFVISLSACSTDNETPEQPSAQVTNTEEKKAETAKLPEPDPAFCN